MFININKAVSLDQPQLDLLQESQIDLINFMESSSNILHKIELDKAIGILSEDSSLVVLQEGLIKIFEKLDEWIQKILKALRDWFRKMLNWFRRQFGKDEVNYEARDHGFHKEYEFDREQHKKDWDKAWSGFTDDDFKEWDSGWNGSTNKNGSRWKEKYESRWGSWEANSKDYKSSYKNAREKAEQKTKKSYDDIKSWLESKSAEVYNTENVTHFANAMDTHLRTVLSMATRTFECTTARQFKEHQQQIKDYEANIPKKPDLTKHKKTYWEIVQTKSKDILKAAEDLLVNGEELTGKAVKEIKRQSALRKRRSDVVDSSIAKDGDLTAAIIGKTTTSCLGNITLLQNLYTEFNNQIRAQVTFVKNLYDEIENKQKAA